MLSRIIRSSLSVRRFFTSSSLAKSRTVGSNPKTAQKLFRLQDPSKAGNVISKLKEEGYAVSPIDIRTAIRGLINHKRYNHALGILDSVVKEKSVKMKAEDYASHLRMIGKVRGLDSSEKYFEAIPEGVKNEFINNTLLEIYVKGGETTKAEALMEKMAGNGVLLSCYPYIQMMSLYMLNGKDDKAEEMIKEVKKRIAPKFRLYNIWLNACLYANNVEAAEMVFSEMKEAKVEPNWLTHSFLACLYIKNKMFEKAAASLNKMEELLYTADRYAYSSALSKIADIGNKDGVLRIWEKMKSKFNNLQDYEYSLMVFKLLQVGWYEKAEEINSEWVAFCKKRGRGLPKLHGTALELFRKARDEKNSPVVEDDKAEKPEEESVGEIQ